jgi:hypothetical protein
LFIRVWLFNYYGLHVSICPEETVEY